MDDLRIYVDLEPSRADLDLISKGLNQHSVAYVTEPGFQPIALLARDTGDELLGGAYGFVNWSWLHVRLLWVSPKRRKEGLGSRLLSEIEAEAIKRGCLNAHLDTFSFQAREFYEAHDYEVFAELPNYPASHRRVFLKKPLLPNDAA